MTFTSQLTIPNIHSFPSEHFIFPLWNDLVAISNLQSLSKTREVLVLSWILSSLITTPRNEGFFSHVWIASLFNTFMELIPEYCLIYLGIQVQIFPPLTDCVLHDREGMHLILLHIHTLFNSVSSIKLVLAKYLSNKWLDEK